MRSGIVGFLAGAATVLVALLVFQLLVIRESADDLSYRFSAYIFDDAAFPWSFFDSGRVVTRYLFPVRVKITYYDAQYHAVTTADQPGRYGAVVRIGLNGGVVTYRYVTLYRTPKKIFWSDGPGKIPTVMLPTGTGVDLTVEHNQQGQSGETIKNEFFTNAGAAVLLAGLSETSPADPDVARTSAATRDATWWYGLRKRLGLVTPYPLIVDLPDGYGTDPMRKWPLILFLHSNAGAGTDPHLVRDFELPGHIKAGLRLPAVVVSPQGSRHEDRSPDQVFDLLEGLLAKYPIDPDKVYLVGDSGGGDLALSMATLHPERFAAIVTVAGEGDFADAARLKDLPFWAFEGLNDNLVMPSNVSDLVADIDRAGGHAHVTLYPGVGHAAWDKAYATDALFTWLFAQKRGQPEVLTPGVPSP